MQFSMLLISQIFAVFLGNSLIALFFNKDKARLPLLERLALSYVIGMGIIPLYMILMYLLKMKFTLANIYIPPLVLIIIVSIFVQPFKDIVPIKPSGEKMSLLNAAFIGGICFEIFHSFFRALIKPIESFDSVASFAIKAKIFFLEKGVPQDFFKTIATHFPHPSYPLMIPLQETFCFLNMGAFNDLLVKILFPLHFLSLIILFYFSLKAITSEKCALIFTFILCSLNEFNRFSATGFADIHFSLYFCLGFIYWYRYIMSDSKPSAFIFISAIFSAFAIFTKNAGFIIPFFYLILFWVRLIETGNAKRVFSTYSSYFIILIILISPWLLIRYKYDLGQVFISKNILNVKYLIQSLSMRTVSIIYEFQVNVFGPKKWNLLWPIFIILFALNYKWSISFRLKYVTLIISFFFIAYFIFYVAVEPSTFGIDKSYALSLRSGMNRHLIHIVPLVMLWMAEVFKEKI